MCPALTLTGCSPLSLLSHAEKLMLSCLATPTCRRPSPSDGASSCSGNHLSHSAPGSLLHPWDTAQQHPSSPPSSGSTELKPSSLPQVVAGCEDVPMFSLTWLWRPTLSTPLPSSHNSFSAHGTVSDFRCLLSLMSLHSHAVALTRDSERLGEVKKRINVLPLGR